MILFLNFAPIEFMGGAEKWMLKTAKKINSRENTLLVSVSEEISNVYGRLVLNREFDKRVGDIDMPYLKINFKALIPFSKEWKEVAKKFNLARIIYAKYEFQELLLIGYYGGIPALKKTTVGVHSPLIYETPVGFFNKLHNKLYQSTLSKVVLSILNKVHVLTKKDELILSNNFSLKNVVYVPNGIEESKKIKDFKRSNILRILFVGELSYRKGVDILENIAKNLPDNMSLTVVGDGPFARVFRRISIKKNNINYFGYVSKAKLEEIYERNDILILPSRAESMPLSILEAMSHGLYIIDSSNISLNFGDKIEYSVKRFEYEDYLAVLKLFSKYNDIDRKKIISFFRRNYSDAVIDFKLNSQIFAYE